MLRVLVTGGAGFIGSHLVDRLLARGDEVRVLDSLEPQVHGPEQQRPGYLDRRCELIVGDVRDPAAMRKALQGVEVVFHQAAVVGVAQSMYEPRRYMDVNSVGTASLLEVLTAGSRQVRRVVVASSMSIYGEGAYQCPACGPEYPAVRSETALAAREWDPHCSRCSSVLAPMPTSENKPLNPVSPYAIGKRDQEELVLSICRAYDIPAIALRYFNVYGPRQALANPYTGAAAIFASRILNGRPPVIYEDGCQLRDFTHVSDIVQANLLAADTQEIRWGSFNIGTGRALSILDLASRLAEALGPSIHPEISHKFRAGDIRHCYADVTAAREGLGYEPKVPFEAGITDLIEAVRSDQVADGFQQASEELSSRGLVR